MGWLNRRQRPLSAQATVGKSAGRGCGILIALVLGAGFVTGGLTVIFGTFGEEEGLIAHLVGIGITGVGVGIVLFGLRLWWIGEPSRGRPGVHAPDGPRTLKTDQTPGCALLFLVPFTLIFASASTWMWIDGGAPWFFALVFSGASVLLLLVTAWAFLSLFNPRPEVDIEVDRIPLGTPLALSWRLTGGTRRIGTLWVALVGREEASYTRGTDTVTDREAFVERTLAKIEDRLGIQGGELALEIPGDKIPSLDAPRNKIVWALRFHSTIRYWPDLDTEVVLPVGPHDTGGTR